MYVMFVSTKRGGGGSVSNCNLKFPSPVSLMWCFYNFLYIFYVLPNFANLFIYLFIFLESNQIEDPRQQWRQLQEAMLKDYLLTAQEDLAVCIFLIFTYMYIVFMIFVYQVFNIVYRMLIF